MQGTIYNGSDSIDQQKTVAAADQKLEQLVKIDFLTEDGKDWFTLATDPFHDERFNYRGYPDTNIQNSVIQRVSKSVQISHTTENASYDCHIVMWPQMDNQDCQKYRDAGLDSAPVVNSNWYKSASASPGIPSQGGLTWQCTENGSPTCSGTLTGDTLGYVDCAEYISGACRVIGMGFEVHDTTAKLYQQGAVAVYRSPGVSNTNSNSFAWFNVYNNYTKGNFVPIPVQYITGPPTTLADAMLLPGTKQWEASKGAYCVSTLSSLENPAFRKRIEEVVVNSWDPGYVYGGKVTQFTLPGEGAFSETGQFQHLAPFNISGAYFTGLNPLSTLTVNVIWYIERFPSPEDRDLVVLANPSSAFDSQALELYSETMNKLPVGVPVGWNPLGEWFEDVIDDVAGFAAPALAAAGLVFPEFAPILEPLAAGTQALKSQVLAPRRKARAEAAKAKKKKKKAKQGVKPKQRGQ